MPNLVNPYSNSIMSSFLFPFLSKVKNILFNSRKFNPPFYFATDNINSAFNFFTARSSPTPYKSIIFIILIILFYYYYYK